MSKPNFSYNCMALELFWWTSKVTTIEADQAGYITSCQLVGEQLVLVQMFGHFVDPLSLTFWKWTRRSIRSRTFQGSADCL